MGGSQSIGTGLAVDGGGGFRCETGLQSIGTGPAVDGGGGFRFDAGRDSEIAALIGI